MSEPITAEQVARYVVADAVWAPSVHNTQPWRFTADGQQIGLYADADRGLPVADPDGREMMISCGAALFNIRLALRSLGYVPETRLLADRVRLRRTHRDAFGPEPPPPYLLAALCEAVWPTDEPPVGWQELTRSECFELLASEHLGRLAVVDDLGPVVFPVNFVLDWQPWCSAPSREPSCTPRAAAAGSASRWTGPTAAHTGWSVIVRGEVTEVTDQAELARLRELPLRAWAPGARNRYVRILPAMLTGRRIAAGGNDDGNRHHQRRVQ